MLVKKIETAEDLQGIMRDYGRDNYSYEAYEALINLFNEDPEPVQIDPVAIACEFTEDTPENIADAYDWTIDEMRFRDAKRFMSYHEYQNAIRDGLMDALNNRTWAALLENGNIIYSEF